MTDVCHNCTHPLDEHVFSDGVVTCPACGCRSRYALTPTGTVITPERS